MGDSSRKTEAKPDGMRRTPRKTMPAGETEVGAALRSVYEDMVGEGVPPEMLDLLGKLD